MSNLNEYYSILELSSGASLDEVKKRYRELAKKYHPDNQATGNEEKFKQITKAFKGITDPEPEPQIHRGNPFASSYPFGRQTRSIDFDESNVEIKTSITFAESVLGSKKDIKFNRKSRCQSCNGQGMKSTHNGCTECNGSGQVIKHQNGMISGSTCPKCRGKTSRHSCQDCAMTGVVESEVSVNVNIPGGVQDGNILRLNGMGNYCGSFGPIQQYTDAHLHISVEKDAELSLLDMDVVFNLKLDLSEAVQGCKKTVKTIAGTQDIDIPPMSRNKDEVIISKMGVAGRGNQRNILDVQYPPNIGKLLNLI